MLLSTVRVTVVTPLSTPHCLGSIAPNLHLQLAFPGNTQEAQFYSLSEAASKDFCFQNSSVFSKYEGEKSLPPIRESGRRVWCQRHKRCVQSTSASSREEGLGVCPVTAPKLPLINMFICPLLVFIINYVVFPLPFVVQNTAPGIMALYSPPK